MRREGAKGNIIGDADIEALQSMEPLYGSVEWSTWRSKLEAIFDPIFASVPHVSVRYPLCICRCASLVLTLFLWGGVAIEFERQHGHGSTRGHSLAAGRLQAGHAAVQG